MKSLTHVILITSWNFLDVAMLMQGQLDVRFLPCASHVTAFGNPLRKQINAHAAPVLNFAETAVSLIGKRVQKLSKNMFELSLK